LEEKMKKIGVLLIAILATATILGCSQKQQSTGGESGAPVKITVEVFDRGTDGGKTNPNDNQWSKWIKEKILKDENIIVDFVPVSRGDEVQALINLMAAGTPPDVAYTYNIDGITQWGEQGGLYDVAPYINTTLRDLNDFLGPDLALPGRRMIERSKNNTSGAIYSMPARRMNVARISTFIRKDWLDKLGLPLPTTTQEYYDALVAFKTQDPGKVGRNNVIPFTLAGNRVDWTAGVILESFIDPNLSSRDTWVNSAAERNFNVPGYKEGLRFLNTMWNANLIDRDFSLYKDDNTMRNLIKSGVVGSFSQNWDEIYREPAGLLSDLRKNVPDADIVPVDCMTSSDGITHKISYDAAGVNYFIPKAAKNPDAAMRYLTWLAK
jgi:putative aldouronate transport system substrate-binding protein